MGNRVRLSALRHTLLDGRVLRSGDRPGVEQELWGLLTLYQLLRRAMVTAVESRPGTDPDRASFTTALEAARDQVTAAQGICPTGPPDLPGVIGRAVLATLLPARRPRYSARKIKAPTSRYQARDDARPHTTTAITAIGITITTPPLDTCAPPPRPGPKDKQPRPPRPPTRRQRVIALMNSDPHRAWTGQELAAQLEIKLHNLLTQLAEWSRRASSPTPTTAPTRSTHAQATRPGQTHQTLNYAALARDRLRRPWTQCHLA